MTSLRKKRISKRRKVNDNDTNCDARRETNIIDDLPESLLAVEIFSKLRNPRDVIVCKSVSKRWNSLLSSSSFHYNPSLALILTKNPLCATNDICLESTWKGFHLSSYVDREFHSPVSVLASYKDVLLCMKKAFSWPTMQRKLYIVNPMTMQWTCLPGSVKEISHFPIGLSWNESMSRYYVVLMMKSTPSELKLHVFDSEYGRWKYNYIEHLPWSPSGWCPTQSQALTFNGVLHWLAEDGPIIAYNPNYKYDMTFSHRLQLIRRSQEMHHAAYGGKAVVSESLTVSMGHLRIIQHVCYPFPGDHHLCTWTLVDYKQSIWKQEHGPVYFKDMISDFSWIQDYMRRYILSTTNRHNRFFLMSNFMDLSETEDAPPKNRRRIQFPRPLVCHPNNPLLVYLYLPKSIVSLDVTTKKLQLITNADKMKGMWTNSYWNQYDKVIPMTLQLDPSLVPDHKRVLQTGRMLTLYSMLDRSIAFLHDMSEELCAQR